MNDCINRKAFIGEMEKHYCAPCKGQGGDLGGDWCHSCVINSVLEKLREFPAADKTDECCDVHLLTVPMLSIVVLIAVYGSMTGMGCQNIALNVGRR